MNEIKVTGTVHILIKDKDGNIKVDKDLGHNLVTSAGKAAIAGLVGNTGAITAFSYIACGTSSTAETVSDTTLGAEIVDSGLARVASSVSRVTTSVTNDTVQFTTTFSVSGTKTVQEMGILNAASNGVLLARKLTGAQSMVSGDTLTLTHKIQFT